MSNRSKSKNAILKLPAQTVWVDEDEEVCLNCKYFRQYYRAGEIPGECIPLNKGWCLFHRSVQVQHPLIPYSQNC